MNDDRILIFIPTYNERDNVERIYSQIRVVLKSADILFCDDHSPDGTGDVIDRLVKSDQRVFVLHRHGKLGIGSAHQAGIRWAYQRHYNRLITMDCDFAHSPEYIRDFLNASSRLDVVVGSRYQNPESLKGWNVYRKFLTHTGHFLTKQFLKMPYDATGAFRLYQLNQIPQEIFTLVGANGYAFFFESLYRLHTHRYRIGEVMIHLPTRTYGSSKMTLHGAWQSLTQLLYIVGHQKVDAQHMRNSVDLSLSTRSVFVASNRPYVAQGSLTAQKVQQEWDDYWGTKQRSSHRVYDAVAVFYRVFIIRRILNHFIQKYFDRGSCVLHAGCGSGQVDQDVAQHVQLSAVDIAQEALAIYRRSNPSVEEVVQGDLAELPFPNAQFDGIYNLGVMEHFTHDEIAVILKELVRILKPRGKIILFVPPEFGLSVRFLKIVHAIRKNIFRNENEFHPKEISRIQSIDDAHQTYEQHGLKMIEYYFGIKDFFTYAVVVLEKQI